MKIKKVLNHNAVAFVDDEKKEAVATGLGIGFHRKPGDEIDESRIEKVYYIRSELQSKLLKLLENTDSRIVECAEWIVNYAGSQGLEVKDQVILALSDHISFSLERAKQHIYLPNLMFPEIKILYPQEFEIGLKGLEKIEEVCHVKLPESEAGYIALHLVNFTVDKNESYQIFKFVKGALDIVRETYGIACDENDMDTVRMMTHLKFLAQRIIGNVQWEMEKDDGLYEPLLGRNEKNAVCLKLLGEYIEQIFHYKITRQEETYLLIHLNRLISGS